MLATNLVSWITRVEQSVIMKEIAAEMWLQNSVFQILKACCVRYFCQIFIFRQIIALQKL